MNLKSLAEELTTEPASYEQKKYGTDIVFTFEVNKNQYEVLFGYDGKIPLEKGKIKVAPYEITFGMLKENNKKEVELDRTNKGNANIVFSTVYKILNDFLSKKSPDMIYFSSIKNENEKNSRRMLYRRALKNIKDNNYWTKFITLNQYDEYYVIVNKNKIPNDKSAEKRIKSAILGEE